MKRDNVDRNVSMLYEGIRKYDTGFESKQSEALKRAVRIEYSKSNIGNFTGYYAISVWAELNVNNFRKGKLYYEPVSKYNFKYYFDRDDRLIITERYDSDSMIELVFFYHYDQHVTSILVYDYQDTKKLGIIIRCEYDENNRLTHYLEGRLILSVIFSIEEQKFTYTSSEMSISRTMYIVKWVVNEDKLNWETTVFPIECMHGKPQIKTTRVSKNTIFKTLKRNIEDILKKWISHNIYATMFILDGPETMSIDFAEETTENSDLQSEERWNYACWNQHPEPLWKNETEKNQFILWLENTMPEGNFDLSLIDHQPFIDLFTRLIDELKASGLLGSTINRKIPILVTDLDIYDRIVEINHTINDDEILQDYLAWCDTLRVI